VSHNFGVRNLVDISKILVIIPAFDALMASLLLEDGAHGDISQRIIVFQH